MSDDMEEIINDFLVEAEETLDRIDPLLVAMEDSGFDQNTINDIFRGMHTIKGAAGFLGFQQIVDVSHRAETILKRIRDREIAAGQHLLDAVLKSFDAVRLLLKQIRAKGSEGQDVDTAGVIEELEAALAAGQPGGHPGKSAEEVRARPAVIEARAAGSTAPAAQAAPEPREPGMAEQAEKGAEKAAEKGPDKKDDAIQTLRIGVEKVDQVMNLTGEVVLIRNRLLNLSAGLEQKYSSDQQMESLVEAISFLDLLTSDMQAAVMKMRMQPLKKVFGKFPRLVKEVSASLGKQVDLKISGEQTEVDKSVIENIGDPMVHIIRNAIDHAIETPAERRAAGKPEKGSITINASQKGNQIVIEVSDDGKGIDLEKVKSKAIQKGLITEAEAMGLSRDATVNLIFLPGLSTNDVATELSGRGVGMDVVKNNVSKLNGFIEVITKKGAGTTFRISLPLTLAIIHALLVEVEGAVYAIPLTLVDETMKVQGSGIKDLMDKKVLNIRGKVYPYFELAWLLDGRRTGQRGMDGQAGQDHRYIIVVAVADSRFCIGVDALLGLQEVVIKSITGSGSAAPSILGATISGDGKVILILDLGYIARSLFDKEHVNT